LNYLLTTALAVLALAAPAFSQAKEPATPAQQEIAQRRERIDAIDKEIITLLNERAALALEIGRIRQRANIPPASARPREEEVLRKAEANSRSPLTPAAARRIYELIIAEMVQLQKLDSEKPK
jgi:chorismate mutase